MRGLMLVVVFVGWLCGIASAAGTIIVPPLPAVASTQEFVCNGVDIERRYYDFEPEDSKWWMATGIAVKGEPNFIVVFYLPEHEPNEDETIVYIDADRDGFAEEAVNYAEGRRRWNGQWCNAYTAIREGKP